MRDPASNPPRVCLVTDSYYPVMGGGEAHARLLCAEFRRRGIPVLVVTGHKVRSSPAYEEVDGVPVYRVRPAGYPRLGKYLMLPPAFLMLIALRREYDLLYVCGIRTLGWLAVRAARWLGKGCVLRSESRGELSGGFIWEKTDGRVSPLRKALFRIPIAMRNRTLKRADAFLSIAGVIRAEYEACGVPVRQIVDIPNGINLERFRPALPGEVPTLRRALRLPVEGRLLAYAGKLNRGKGLEFLLRLWKEWSPRHPGTRLLLVGSGAGQFLSCETELRAFVAEHHLDDAVLFAGSVANVEEYLRAADGFVFPSESEAMPLALMEALATRLPTLASDIGGCRAVMAGEGEGWLVPPHDTRGWAAALDQLVTAPAEAARRAEAGREHVARTFGIARIAEEHRVLFRAICSKGDIHDAK